MDCTVSSAWKSFLPFTSYCAVVAQGRPLTNLPFSSARCRQRHRADARKSIPSQDPSRQAPTLKKIQGAAACLWIIYGVNVDATPVIAANLMLAAMAFYSSFAERSTWKQQWSARLNRQPGRSAISPAVEDSRPSGSRTAMVVSMYPPGGLTERASDVS